MSRGSRHLAELEQEILAHIEQETEENIARGMPPEEARRAAHVKFGNIARIQEDVREVWFPPWLESLIQDLRYGLRTLVRNRGFAVTVILLLALGIGVNAAVFNIVYSVLIQPLPFRDPSKLVQLWEATPTLPELQIAVSDFEDWRLQTRSFESMAAYTLQAMNKATLLDRGEPEMIQATMVEQTLFPLLGMSPLLGRVFTSEEQQRKDNVCLISERLWRNKFGADPLIAGQMLRLDTSTFTILGVIPDHQAFPAWADFWMPMTFIEPLLRTTRKFHALESVARLKHGVSERDAQQELRAIAGRLAIEHKDTNGSISAYLKPLSRQNTDGVRRLLLIIWAAVLLVLLVACSNLAHLVLARMERRTPEIHSRLAFGASTARLIRQVLAENLLLAGFGGIAGTLVAVATTRVLQNLASGKLPRMDWEHIQTPVWLVTGLLSVLCSGLLTLPAVSCVSQLHASLASSGRSVTRRRSRLGDALMITEIATAFVVITGSILLIRSFAILVSEDPGFRAAGVITLQVPIPASRYRNEQIGRFFSDRLLPEIKAIPGVKEAALANSAPMSLGNTEHSRFATRFGIEGRTFEAGQFPVAQLRWVSPEYFSVLRIPLKTGRWLTQDDNQKPRYLINETLARKYFPGEDPTRHRILLGVLDPIPNPVKIEGVVGDVRELGMDQPVEPALYTIGNSVQMTALVQTDLDPDRVSQSIRRAIANLDPELATGKAKMMDQTISDSLANRLFALLLVTVFGILSAILAAAGIYGSLAYSVGGRMREFGIRGATGATPHALQRIVLREAARSAIPGLVAGVVTFFLFARFLKSELYQLAPMDPLALSGATAVVILLVLLSAWLPARRAASVDLAASLRTD